MTSRGLVGRLRPADWERPRVGDLVAGLSVALLLIPQSMAYAEIAGLPPFVGLFASALPPLLAAFVASSPFLQTGPVALTSLLTFGALSPLADEATSEFVQLAALLAFVVGVTRVVLGLLRAGAVVYLLSRSARVGFTTGAAILIISSQLPTVFGVASPDDGVLADAWWALTHPGQWEGEALGLACVALLLMLGGRRIHSLFPGVLLAVMAGVVYSEVTGYEGAVVGAIPAGLPELSFALPWGELGSVAFGGAIIALVGFAEPASISRMFAEEEGRPWSASREFVSQGVANVASAASGAFPVGGSFSRSALNRFAGARTRWSGAATGVVVLAFLPFSDILETLPRAILGAVVVGAVFTLIRVTDMVKLWRETRAEGFVAFATFVATLATAPSVERGVLIGVVLAVGLHVWRGFTVDGRGFGGLLEPDDVTAVPTAETAE